MYKYIYVYIYCLQLLAEYYVRFISFFYLCYFLRSGPKRDYRTQRVIIQTSDITVYLLTTSFVSRIKSEIGGAKYLVRRKT